MAHPVHPLSRPGALAELDAELTHLSNALEVLRARGRSGRDLLARCNLLLDSRLIIMGEL